MDEVDITVRKSQRTERKEARRRIREAIRAGDLPSDDDSMMSRGLVIRERHNSIFSDAWVSLAVIILIVGLLADRNVALLAVGAGLAIIAMFGSFWRRLALRGVTYQRSFDRTHVFPGEPIMMTLTISNHKPLPLTWLQFKDDVPYAPEEKGLFAVIASEIGGRYILENTLSMNAYERTRRQLTFRFPRRGYQTLGPVRYLSGDIFTLFTIEREYRYLDTLVVYPKVWPLEELQLPAKEMFGELQVQRSLFTDPIKTQAIRDYQPQDRFRDVHWKATARRGNLQTKVYDPISGMTVVTFLNVATYPRHWLGFDPNLLERAISVAASICSYAAEQKWGIGVFANGSIPGSDQPIRVPPGHSPDQLMRILEVLAAATEFATGSIESLMHSESPKLPWAATLVLVTAVVTEEIALGLVRLKGAGRRVTLVSLADDPPPKDMPGVLVYHIPTETNVFDSGQTSVVGTEAALGAVPVPEDSWPDDVKNGSSDGENKSSS